VKNTPYDQSQDQQVPDQPIRAEKNGFGVALTKVPYIQLQEDQNTDAGKDNATNGIENPLYDEINTE